MGESGGQIISGKDIAASVRNDLSEEIRTIRESLPGFAPRLCIVQVGDRTDSNVYIRMKAKAAEEIGIKLDIVRLPASTCQSALVAAVEELNSDWSVHGIIVQLPLDSDIETAGPIDTHLITNTIDPSKDVDGMTTVNEGRLATGDLAKGMVACTPSGCLRLIQSTGVEIRGANAVVIGRSQIVGTPMSELLKWHDATVTICHSKTKDLDKIVAGADIVVAAVGRPKMVKGSWIKPGAVVIDCGINSVPDPTKKSGKGLVGDVDFQEAIKVASHITPVPGGVGPMTVALLMQNTVEAAKRAIPKSGNWQLSLLKINPLEKKEDGSQKKTMKGKEKKKEDSRHDFRLQENFQIHARPHHLPRYPHEGKS